MSCVTELTTCIFMFLAALFSHNSQVRKPTKLPNKRGINKENGVCMHNGIFSTIKENKVEAREMAHGLRALLALPRGLSLVLPHQAALNYPYLPPQRIWLPFLFSAGTCTRVHITTHRHTYAHNLKVTEIKISKVTNISLIWLKVTLQKGNHSCY